MRIGNKLAAIVGFAALLAGSALVSDRAVAATVLYDNLGGTHTSAGSDASSSKRATTPRTGFVWRSARSASLTRRSCPTI